MRSHRVSKPCLLFPCAGLLFDHTATYLPSLYAAGALLVLSAAIMVVPWRYRRVQLVSDAESAHSGAETELSSDGSDPPTPVKEPARPEDFLYPPAVAGVGLEVDLGEAAGRPYVWQAPESEQNQPLMEEEDTGEGPGRPDGRPESDGDEERRLLLGNSPAEGEAQPEPTGGESRLALPEGELAQGDSCERFPEESATCAQSVCSPLTSVPYPDRPHVSWAAPAALPLSVAVNV